MTTEEQMRLLIDDFEKRGGGNRVAFCQEVGVKHHTFKYWQRKIKVETQSNGFLTVKTNTTSVGSLEILYPNGVIVRLAGENNTAQLGQLIRLF